MIELIGPHRLDDASIVGQAGDMRHHVAEPGAVLAVLLKLMRSTEQFRNALEEWKRLAAEHFIRTGLHVHFLQLRFPIKEIERWRSARHVEIDNRFGTRTQSRGLNR